MKIAITFTDQNPDGGAVIGKEAVELIHDLAVELEYKIAVED